MQYMMLVYDDPQVLAKMTQAQQAEFMLEYHNLVDALVKSGHFRGGSQLQPATNATTVRQRGGKPLTVDGPFAETKEQLGGFFLIESKDLDEALAIARRIPSSRTGSIEVRPMVPPPEGAALPPR